MAHHLKLHQIRPGVVLRLGYRIIIDPTYRLYSYTVNLFIPLISKCAPPLAEGVVVANRGQAVAALWPTRRAGQLTFVALALRAITNIAKGSHMSNSQLWATQHDLALLLALAAAALRKGSLETLTAAGSTCVHGQMSQSFKSSCGG